MVYFELNHIAFECGLNKEECSRYPDCELCIKEKLKEMGFEIHSNIQIQMLDSEEKRERMYQNLIWEKFLNILNIKHIILMSKESGTSILDYPITGAGLDVDLLTGFVQANISFSENEIDDDEDSSGYELSGFEEEHYYEFDYKDFNILLQNGDSIRACLVLEKGASKSLKTQLSEFIDQFEFKYRRNLKEFHKTGHQTFNTAKDFIIKKFNIELVFPQILSHTIPPNVTEKINQNYVQKAIMKIANELLLEKPFFFINNIIHKVKKIVKNIDLKKVLYEIYQLIEMNIILPMKLEDATSKIESFKQERGVSSEKKMLITRLSSKTKSDDIESQIKDMEDEEARELMEKFDKKGKSAEQALIYQDALSAYEKAQHIAKKFSFQEAEGKFSFKVLDLKKKIVDMELNYYEEAGKKAEKENNYITSINYYKKAIELLEQSLHSVQVNPEATRKKIDKINKKISKIQEKL
ncbi:MAG: hypothetical protein EU547_03470 [Promethearchaeota archaeon]|nr:MAG: hypothetical protein EU547_03470 [Candidatus Lokiarchaeota archaeon]